MAKLLQRFGAKEVKFFLTITMEKLQINIRNDKNNECYVNAILKRGLALTTFAYYYCRKPLCGNQAKALNT